jgi:hypothetical protein
MSSPIDPDAFNAFEAAGWDEPAITYHRAFLPLTKQVIEPLLDGGAGPNASPRGRVRRRQRRAPPVHRRLVRCGVANFAIPHFGRPEQAVAEFARVLSSGGNVALSTLDMPATSRLPGVFYDADEAEFTRLLRDAGLVDTTVSTVAFPHHFIGDLFDCLVEGTMRTRALVFGQPEATQARIRAALDRHTAGYAADGGFELPISVKIASGRTT